MATIKKSYTVLSWDGVTNVVLIPFPYLKKSHIYVYVGGVLQVLGTDYTINNQTINWLNIPAAGVDNLLIKRITDRSKPVVSFKDGAGMLEDNLNTAFLQSFYISQEIEDGTFALNPPDLDADGNKIKNLATPTADNDAATKKYVDDADTALQTSVSSALSSTLTTVDNKIATALDTVSTELSDTETLVNSAVSNVNTQLTSALNTVSTSLSAAETEINGAVADAHQAVTDANTAKDAANSAKTTAQSAAAAAAQSVVDAQNAILPDNSISTQKIVNNAVVTNKIVDGAITSSKLSDTLDLSAKTLTLPSDVTRQGNTFNAANKLLKLDASGKIPSLDGSQLTGIASGYTGFRNRIINGDMLRDQRYAGTSITPSATAHYLVDRFFGYNLPAYWNAQQNRGSVTPPAGFTKYLGLAVTAVYGGSAPLYLSQKIEGYNVSDLDFGKSTAKTVTLSFWIYSNLTGTFGGSLQNSAGTRSYPFSYTISAANTWEKKTITITGDTSGTWLYDSNTGIQVSWLLNNPSAYLGAANAWASTQYFGATGSASFGGTIGNLFYITGVQLEAGSSATEFEKLPIGVSLAQCQRYFRKSFDLEVAPQNGYGYQGASGWNLINGNVGHHTVYFSVPMRVYPTTTFYNPRSGGTAGYITDTAADYQPYIEAAGQTSILISKHPGSADTSDARVYVHMTNDAEL